MTPARSNDLADLRRRVDVLIVEDDNDLREALAESFRAEGYTVAEADHGQSAMKHLQESVLPRVILLDLMMPVMDGWGFRTAQLQDPLLASLPVIVITGDGRPAARAVAADEYVTKPIDFDRLLTVVRRFD